MNNYIQHVLASTPLIYILLEYDGTINYVSPGLQKVLGLNPDEVRHQNWFKLTRSNSVEYDLIKKKINQFTASSETILSNYVEKMSDAFGNNVYILWNTIKTPDNKLVGTGQDITRQMVHELELSKYNKRLKSLNSDINDSIKYAARLQNAILKSPDELKSIFPNSSILYKPKDIVSGDFYFFTEIDGFTFVAVIDCTGHGVPGAMLSIIANTLLRDIISKRKITSCAEILSHLDIEFTGYLNENNPNLAISDGMDISLCRFDKERKSVCYAGAFRPLIIIREDEVLTYKANRFPIGLYSNTTKYFEEEMIEIQPMDHLVLFTDGFVDQFGGEKGKKFNRKRFTELLVESAKLEGDVAGKYLDYNFGNWKQSLEQVDDVTVIQIHI
jgi:serine phosphatase RsbU (regulator of sigma subunit)